MTNKLSFDLESHERAEKVNTGLFLAQYEFGGTILYVSDTEIHYEVDTPREAIDWLVEFGVIDPTCDVYTVEEDDADAHTIMTRGQ